MSMNWTLADRYAFVKQPDKHDSNFGSARLASGGVGQDCQFAPRWNLPRRRGLFCCIVKLKARQVTLAGFFRRSMPLEHVDRERRDGDGRDRPLSGASSRGGRP
jgi:hypothetical protein